MSATPVIPLKYAANVGQLTDLVVENMLEQYEEFSRRHYQQMQLELRPIEQGQIAVVAVTPGAGLAAVFQQLGVNSLVNGGQTNNPSVEEFMKAINKLNTDKIIILPNNKNIILTAQQAASLIQNKQVSVVPTRTIPQGISAMLTYRPDGEFETVSESMIASKDNIITAEVTTATRSVELEGVKVESGQIIGLINGKLRIAGDSEDAVVTELLSSIDDLDDMELVTLYYGASITEEDAETLVAYLEETFPDLEFEIVNGGQPHYPYILGVE